MTDPAALLIDRSVAAARRSVDETSWVEVLGGFVRDPQAALDEVLQGGRWEQGEVLRSVVII